MSSEAKSASPALSGDPKNPGTPRRGGASPERGAWPPVGLTSLDDSETFVDRELAGTHAQRRIHSPWAGERCKIVASFADSEDPALQKRAVSIAQCCASPMLMADASGVVRVCPIRCRDRLCPLCATRRAREAATKYGEAVARMDAARHIVLTAPAVDAPLREQLRGLQDAIKRVRAHHAWRGRVSGGVYTIEVTRNRKTGMWHPHVHIIADGEYFPQVDLVDTWRTALSSSSLWSHLSDDDAVIVHVSAVHNRHQLARYIAKYIAKPAELKSWPVAALQEYALAVAGRRMMHTFGSLHGVKLGVDDANKLPDGSAFVIGMAELDWRGVQGHACAKRAIALLKHLNPHVRLWFGTPDDPSLDEWAANHESPAAELKSELYSVRGLTGRNTELSSTKDRPPNHRTNQPIQFRLFQKNETEKLISN